MGRRQRVQAAAIYSVAAGSAAEAAGLRVGDVVLRANGFPMSGVDKLDLAVRRARANDGDHTLSLEVVRGAERLTIAVAIAPPQ